MESYQSLPTVFVEALVHVRLHIQVRKASQNHPATPCAYESLHMFACKVSLSDLMLYLANIGLPMRNSAVVALLGPQNRWLYRENSGYLDFQRATSFPLWRGKKANLQNKECLHKIHVLSPHPRLTRTRFISIFLGKTWIYKNMFSWVAQLNLQIVCQHVSMYHLETAWHASHIWHQVCFKETCIH